MRTFSAVPGLAALALTLACDAATPPEPVDTPALSQSPAVAGSASAIQIGRQVAPVPLDLKGKNPGLVWLGSYVVASHACSDCHTSPPFAPGGDPFAGQPEQTNVAGYLAGGVPFGPFTSRNLTPRADGLPAGLTRDEFLLVMRTGIDVKERHPDISPLLQVMPWPSFHYLTDHELDAIYEYLRAIPCVARPDQNPVRCAG